MKDRYVNDVLGMMGCSEITECLYRVIFYHNTWKLALK